MPTIPPINIKKLHEFPERSGLNYDDLLHNNATGLDYKIQATRIADFVQADLFYDTLAELIAETDAEKVKAGKRVVTFANQNGAAVKQEWKIVDATALPQDGGQSIALTGTGKYAEQVFGSTVCPRQFGAVPDNDSAEVALINREAFRECLRSYSDSYAAVAGQKDLYIVEPRSGDYNLSNGFTIPTGMTLRASIGQVRIKILGATVDADPKIALCTLNKVIDRSTHALSNSVGRYVLAPPAHVDNIYLNPQNSNVAIECAGAGYKVGKIWVQAETAVKFTGNDGIVDELIIEDGTINGLNFAGGQNHVIGSVYTFVVDNPIIVTGSTNNIDIDTIQCNYTKVACLQTNNSLTIGRMSIGRLVCNQNAQYGTFTSVIRTRSDACDIRIGELDARNYNGYAWNNEQGLSNRVRIGHVKLRQTPNNASYTLGTTAKGFRVNNAYLYIDSLDIAGLADSPFEVTGTFAAELDIRGGIVGTYTGSNPVVNISNTSTSSIITINGVNNKSSNGLFNAQQYISPTFRNCIAPFKNVTESSRVAIKIPFCDQSSVYDITVTANTNTAGSGNYRRTLRGQLTHETSYNGAFSTAATWTTLVNTGLHTAFTPDITPQVDITSVGTGAEVAYLTSGYLVLSVPNTYVSVTYRVNQLHN